MGRDWLYEGRYYTVLMLSDVSEREGMALELEDVGPAPGRGMVAKVFYRDADGAMTFSCYVEEGLPAGLVERFVALARRLLPPGAGADLLADEPVVPETDPAS